MSIRKNSRSRCACRRTFFNNRFILRGGSRPNIRSCAYCTCPTTRSAIRILSNRLLGFLVHFRSSECLRCCDASTSWRKRRKRRMMRRLLRILANLSFEFFSPLMVVRRRWHSVLLWIIKKFHSVCHATAATCFHSDPLLLQELLLHVSLLLLLLQQ